MQPTRDREVVGIGAQDRQQIRARCVAKIGISRVPTPKRHGPDDFRPREDFRRFARDTVGDRRRRRVVFASGERDEQALEESAAIGGSERITRFVQQSMVEGSALGIAP
ncbi:MAG: hypothetical protein U0841_24110 [Chloroflexia bacterium]